jgi:hypothetical protein
VDPTKQFNRRTNLLVFGAVMLVALAWALATNHVWEDYYITYRSSKNLATGHGLVFNDGDRLHTFTSPLGVLLPAAASYLTGTQSDAAAIWVFRFWSAAALGGAALLVLAVARRRNYGIVATVALIALLVLDGKSLDFTTNGMETGFLLLFIAYTLWAMFAAERRRWLHLGLAWGGLMWTRPDGFLYVGLMSAGVFLFNDPARTGLARGQWLKLFLQAGVVCTLVYLPWLEWAWWYYGTPVPHTIIAKGGVSGSAKTIGGALKTLVEFPVTVWTGRTSLESTFLPSYFQIGGWPAAAVNVARGLALVLAFQWIVPWWRTEVRMASLAFCGLHVYLSYFPFFPFPWYLPGTAIFAALTLGGMIAQVWDWVARWRTQPARERSARVVQWSVVLVVLAAVGGECWLTWQMKREMTLEQIYSATGTRRRVGEWLKVNAKPGDTVFMEPLGHIGYFSGLKTYDFPGLSSREMVAAIKAVGTDWARLIDYLSPDWLVLRPQEIERVRQAMPSLLGPGNVYTLAQEMDNLPQIRRLEFYGRNYVEFDAHLLIFHRQTPKPIRAPVGPTPFQALRLPATEISGQPLYRLPVRQAVSLPVPAGAKHFWLMYGLPPVPAASAVAPDDCVEFTISLKYPDGLKVEQLFTHRLRPSNPADRSVCVFNAKLPRMEPGAVLLLTTSVPAGSRLQSAGWGEPEYTR